MQHDRPCQPLADPRPVFEALVEKACRRNDQNAFVPSADRHEAHPDFLHAPGLIIDLDQIPNP